MDSHVDSGARLLGERLAGGMPQRLDDALRLFVRAGYARVGVETIGTHLAVHFVVARPVDRNLCREEMNLGSPCSVGNSE